MHWFWQKKEQKSTEQNKELAQIAIYQDDQVDFPYTVIKDNFTLNTYIEHDLQYIGKDKAIEEVNIELRQKALALGADCLLNVHYNFNDCYCNASEYLYVATTCKAVKRTLK